MTAMQTIRCRTTNQCQPGDGRPAFHQAVVAAFMVLLPTGLLGNEQAKAQTTGDLDPSQRVQTPFADGILIEIPPAPAPAETFSGPFEIAELKDRFPELDWTSETHPDGKPHFESRSRTVAERLKAVTFRREVFCLEFSFKPLRQVFMDLPAANGATQRKLVTYMVYRLRYRGGDLRPATEKVGGADIFRRIEAVSYKSKRVFPNLTLVNHENDREFADKILPSAKAPIARREQITVPLHNSVEIGKLRVPYSADSDAPGIWGLATWTDIDPDIDFLSVDIFGLTDAFEHDGLEQDAPYRRKALSLNFFRPGDSMDPTADRIRFGVPPYSDAAEQKQVLNMYGMEERLDYRWIFR
ncbi:MAG: hypothetical protein AAF989_05070 [Planctomycetota bacterium]